MVEVVVAAVAGDEYETAWYGKMNCASGRIEAADLVRGFYARLGKKSLRTAEES